MVLRLAFLQCRFIDFDFFIEKICLCASANELRAKDVSFADN